MMFVDQHSLSQAFVGYRLGRLLDLIIEQGDDYLAEEGLSFPTRAISTLLIIDESENVSIADITAGLGHPHQLVAQRVKLLIDAGLIKREPDSKDARRKIIKLTKKGREETRQLRVSLAKAQQALMALFQDLGVNLNDVTDRAFALFSDQSLNERVLASSEKPPAKRSA